MSVIRSRDNARVKAWVRLADDPRERRKQGLALLEGVHLVGTFLQTGGRPETLIASETAIARPEVARLVAQGDGTAVVLADGIFRRISDAETPSGIAAEISIRRGATDPASSPGCVFLDGLQDAGNVGTIIRSASAFGIAHVFIGSGCADPWSPKALRAGMGGHFLVQVSAVADLAHAVARFGAKTICASAHGGMPLDSLDLCGRVGWIFGSEAAGASAAVAASASQSATIATPGAAESLNVAASAAICFYERERQLSKRGARS